MIYNFLGRKSAEKMSSFVSLRFLKLQIGEEKIIRKYKKMNSRSIREEMSVEKKRYCR